MRYLLDASALLPLITRRGKLLISEASRANLATTDLAIYEACNSLWKLASLLKFLSLDDALDVARILEDLVTRGIIQPIDFAKLNLSGTLKIAYMESLTFYDTSYIMIAKNAEAVLVTEDEQLQKAAKKFVKAITYSDLESKLTQA